MWCFYAGWLPSKDIALSQPEPTLALTSGIAKNGGRLLFFVGKGDFLVTAQQRDEIARALQEAKVRYEMVVYPNAQHGFFCEERDTFDKTSRDDAWERTLKLYAEELRS